MSEQSVMGRLSNQAVLSAWEEGSRQGPVGHALAMLHWALPEGDARELDAWPIGRRDAALLNLRAAAFGPRIAGRIACPACGEELDLGFQVDDVRAQPAGPSEPLELTAADPPYRIVFRLPVSDDLRAAAQAADIERGRRLLAERCLLTVERDGEAIPAREVPDELIDRMSELMALHDPQSAIDLSLTCPACGHAWQAMFDIADFLWREVTAQARRLVSDVHTLALAYGWREDDILSMGDGRRQMYLDLVL